MIIIGYQGIGKSFVAGVESGYIDLESSSFCINGKKHDDWYVPYCRVALELSQQGFTVFVSSHKEVREYLIRHIFGNHIICVFPEPQLQADWIKRLQKRYNDDPSEKNYRALINAKDRYKENVEEMKSWGGYYYGIDDIEFDLRDIIKEIQSITKERSKCI